METPTEGLDVLIKKILQTEDAKEQYELAHKIFMLSPKDFRDMQALNRAIKGYCSRYPEVSRALDQLGAMCRSIPPEPDGGITTYLRREAACAALDATRKRWSLEFRERKLRNKKKEERYDIRREAIRAIARMERMERINADNLTGRKRPSSYPPPALKRRP